MKAGWVKAGEGWTRWQRAEVQPGHSGGPAGHPSLSARPHPPLSCRPQFVINGLMWPDRTPHPAAYELKHLQAPLGICLPAAAAADGPAPQAQQAAGEEVHLRLRNKQHFASSRGLALRWRLLLDGRPAQAATASAAAGKGSGATDADGWQPLALEQALAPQQEAAVGLGASWGQLAAAAAGAAEACLEVQAQVGAAGCGWLGGTPVVGWLWPAPALALQAAGCVCLLSLHAAWALQPA